MGKKLLEEVKSLHVTARTENLRLAEIIRCREEAKWLCEEKCKAREIIRELPGKLRDAARRGEYSFTVYEWTDGRRGFWEDKKGVPVIVANWCKQNGFKISESVGREGHGPETGRLVIFLHDL